MFIIQCKAKSSGAAVGWLLSMSPVVEKVHVTKSREKARRFKQESDAALARAQASRIAQDYHWKIVSAV